MVHRSKKAAARNAPSKSAAKKGASKKAAAGTGAKKSAAKKTAAKSTSSTAQKSAATKKSAAANASPPDAVRVWRGYRLSSLAVPDFLTALGSIFMPVTVQLQRLYGLTAYLPAVPPTEKPAGVPDEIALVFYETQQAYTDQSKLIVAGRAYSRLHTTVFDFPKSLSGFPVPLPNQLAFDTPYFLFTDAADWQTGFTQVFIGTRKASMPQEKFSAVLQDFLNHVRDHRPKGLDGAICCVNANWIIYWEHWTSEAASLKGHISDLAKLSDLVMLKPSATIAIETDLTAHYPGITVKGGQSFNLTFPLAGKS
jgi:hypothetical protein